MVKTQSLWFSFFLHLNQGSQSSWGEWLFDTGLIESLHYHWLFSYLEGEHRKGLAWGTKVEMERKQELLGRGDVSACENKVGKLDKGRKWSSSP